MKSRTTSVDIVRFIFALLVAYYHFIAVHFRQTDVLILVGALVDFFFILSGFFMMKSLEKDSSMSIEKYLFKKCSSFYAVFIVAASMQFVLFVIKNNLSSLQAVLLSLFHFKWEFMLLQVAGFIHNPQFNTDYLLGPSWFLSAMLISILILYPFAQRFKKTFTVAVCPIAVILLYAYIISTSGTLDVGREFYGIISSAVFRGIAGTCLGAIVFEVYSHFKEKDFSNKRLATILEVCTYAFTVLFIYAVVTQDLALKSENGLFFVLVFAFLVGFAFINKTPISQYLNSHGTGIAAYLGGLSLYVYLLHWPIMWSLSYLKASQTNEYIIYFITCLMLSILTKFLNEKRKNIFPIIIFVLSMLLISCVLPYWTT